MSAAAAPCVNFTVIAACKATFPHQGSGLLTDQGSRPAANDQQSGCRDSGENRCHDRERSGAGGWSLDERRAAPGGRHLHLNPVACLKRVPRAPRCSQPASAACAGHRGSPRRSPSDAREIGLAIPLGAGPRDRPTCSCREDREAPVCPTAPTGDATCPAHHGGNWPPHPNDDHREPSPGRRRSANTARWRPNARAVSIGRRSRSPG